MMKTVRKCEMTTCMWRYERPRDDGLDDSFHVGYDIDAETGHLLGRVSRGAIESSVAPYYDIAEAVDAEEGKEQAVLRALYRAQEALREHLEAINEVIEEWEKKVEEEEEG